MTRLYLYTCDACGVKLRGMPAMNLWSDPEVSTCEEAEDLCPEFRGEVSACIRRIRERCGVALNGPHEEGV